MKKKLKWKANAVVRSALNDLIRKRKLFDRAGKELVKACDGYIFPADVYFIATCNRALQNFDAFSMAMKADYYSTSMVLMRVQLDSVLRCYGLTQTKDPHAAAQEVINGSKLSNLKDKLGKKLIDSHLVDLVSNLAETNKVIKHIYTLSSSYVHLSDSAIHHMLGRARPMPTGTQQGIFIGSAEPHVPMAAKLQLVQAFERITNALIELTLDWANKRVNYENVDDLIKKYGPRSWSVPTTAPESVRFRKVGKSA
jgi:hypothetical protein